MASGAALTFSERLQEIRTGFERPFWVANISELFERLSYYAAFASLARYLHETLNFGVERASGLTGLFGGLVWFLAAFGGTLADRLGFRRSLSLAYLILSCSYFLIGSIGSLWFAPIRGAVPLVVLVTLLLMLPALGVALVKPCVVGTTARASKESVRSIGYSIYYTLVNVGGALGPIIAFLVRKQLGLGIANVFRVAALSVFLMFWVTLFFYREPGRSGEKQVSSVGAALKNIFMVLRNLRFLWFLAIFSGFFAIFWQQYISVPIFLRRYVDPNANFDLLLSVDAITVISLQILIAFLTQKMPAFLTMTLGFLVTSLAWILPALHPTMPIFVATLVFVAIGEVMQVSRYYDYISRIAPPGQQGLYMGYAFLPIGVGYFVAGWLGGHLLHYFGQARREPQRMWWAIAGVGILSTILMVVYDRFVKPVSTGTSAQ